ncbi:MAG: cache domain-containing protein [Deltaproteobacteria bacterium]|jgi:two-component system NtrC family sensor kinase|nr:cache domain-containing protein [Deltaproteobacteria bacterium]
MSRYLFKFFNNFKIRWKMIVVVLPLVVVPICIVGTVVGWIAYQQAYLGITQTSKDDLDHLAAFTVDLLDAHNQQFLAYQKDKKLATEDELISLTNLAYNMVEAQDNLYRQGEIDLDNAMQAARSAMKRVQVGETGYIYAMTSKGTLAVHIAREGENVYLEKDEDGRHFIRSMCKAATQSDSGTLLKIVYPWRNPELGDKFPRQKMVIYRYFEPWDWIIATGGYLEETYEDPEAELQAFDELKARIKAKRVGQTGYIYCMDRNGNLMIHPEAEGQNIFDAKDSDGTFFIKEMCKQREGWIRYPWQNPGENRPRTKIVRYLYYAPWDWIVAVGSYEEEFYRETNLIKGRILSSLGMISIIVASIAVMLVFLAAKILSEPIRHMTSVIRDIKRGQFHRQMEVASRDELGELAVTFNRMTSHLQRNRELEASLAQQGKMASLGVLSSGVAHEINNPLGVILGYAGYLEKKLDPADPNHHYIHEIKLESKRCKKIVQDLLNYARTPRPEFAETDLNQLLDQIISFAANHTDMHDVQIIKKFDDDLPPLLLDGDQIRQVAINLILNAGAAMSDGGQLTVTTAREEDDAVITFHDTGCGIHEPELERIFEPFYTTKDRGTGLGLPITKQIIEQHHGSIQISSRVGQGTTMTIRLPLERKEF